MRSAGSESGESAARAAQASAALTGSAGRSGPASGSRSVEGLRKVALGESEEGPRKGPNWFVAVVLVAIGVTAVVLLLLWGPSRSLEIARELQGAVSDATGNGFIDGILVVLVVAAELLFAGLGLALVVFLAWFAVVIAAAIVGAVRWNGRSDAD